MPSIFYTLLIFIAIFKYSSSSIVSTIPFLDYQPAFIQTGVVVAVTNGLTTNWQNQFTVNFLRLKNNLASDYGLAFGIKGFDFYFHPDNSSTTSYWNQVSSKTATQFIMFIRVTKGNYFTIFQINYLAKNNRLAGFHIGETLLNINRNVTTASFFIQNNSFPIPDLPFSSYRVFLSINCLQMAYIDSSTTAFNFYVFFSALNYSTYTIYVASSAVYVDQMRVYWIFIDQNYQNNLNRQNIILPYFISLSYSFNYDDQIYSSVIYNKTQNNCFLGLTWFDSFNNRAYFRYYYSGDNIYLYKNSNMRGIDTNMLLLLGKKCQDPFFYDQSQFICRMCMQYCKNCYEYFICQQCMVNFTLSTGGSSCTCPYNVVSGICFDFQNSPMKGCVSALFINATNSIVCLVCSPARNLVINTVLNSCQCKQYYTRDNSTRQCVDVCGDGHVKTYKCDDGNTNNNDGCDYKCDIETDFDCDNSTIPNYCWSTRSFQFIVLSINKNADNSANIQLSPKFNGLPFNLKLEDFPSFDYINLYLNTPNSPLNTYQLPISILSVQNNKVLIRLDYPFTIQGMQSYFQINLNRSRYPTQNATIYFDMKGDNFPLVYSSYVDLFEKASIGVCIISIFVLASLIAGLLAPKFIGLEAITTLQLIFFSQLLISKAQKWPIGFMMFQYLKFSNGYNQIFQITSYNLSSQQQIKYNHLKMSKSIIQNFNISFCIIFITAIVFFILMLLRIRFQKELILKKQQENQILDKGEIRKGLREYKYWLDKNNLCYNCLSQLTFWGVLQILAAFAAQTQIQNQDAYIHTFSQRILLRLRGPVFIIASVIILSVGLNNFINVYLSEVAFSKMKSKMMVLNYKRFYFLYLSVIGYLILFSNKVILLEKVPISVIVLAIHIIYILILIIINPYQLSLRIHSVGLFVSQGIYLIFLVSVNYINFLQTNQIDEFMIVILGYFMLLLCSILVILTGFRLYYEYRYGEVLQNKIQKQRELRQKKKLQQQEELLRRKMKKIQKENQNKLTAEQKKKQKNQFLYLNQKKVEQMRTMLNWLEDRFNWTKQMKQQYYYRHFNTKPIQWLQQYDKQQYQKKIMEVQNVKKEKQKKKKHSQKDSQYKKVLLNLKQSFQRKQQQKFNRQILDTLKQQKSFIQKIQNPS